MVPNGQNSKLGVPYDKNGHFEFFLLSYSFYCQNIFIYMQTQLIPMKSLKAARSKIVSKMSKL